jgi:hypothetical protein
MDGLWRRERKGRRVEITIEPFGRLAKGVRPVAEAEAERLAAFVGGDLALRWA